jgi:hypothetical protein
MKIWQDLKAGETKVAMKAVTKAREQGTAKWLKPLLEAYRDREEDEVREAIGELLGTLKVSAGEDFLVEAISDPEFKGLEADIIGFMWSCGFLPERALVRVVECAVSGDFRAAIEGLTWVDQVEDVENEHGLLEAILTARGGLADASKSEVHSLIEPLIESLEKLERAQ